MNIDKQTKIVLMLDPEEATDIFNVIHGILDEHDLNHGASESLTQFVNELEPYL